MMPKVDIWHIGQSGMVSLRAAERPQGKRLKYASEATA